MTGRTKKFDGCDVDVAPGGGAAARRRLTPQRKYQQQQRDGLAAGWAGTCLGGDCKGTTARRRVACTAAAAQPILPKSSPLLAHLTSACWYPSQLAAPATARSPWYLREDRQGRGGSFAGGHPPGLLLLLVNEQTQWTHRRLARKGLRTPPNFEQPLLGPTCSPWSLPGSLEPQTPPAAPPGSPCRRRWHAAAAPPAAAPAAGGRPAPPAGAASPAAPAPRLARRCRLRCCCCCCQQLAQQAQSTAGALPRAGLPAQTPLQHCVSHEATAAPAGEACVVTWTGSDLHNSRRE